MSLGSNIAETRKLRGLTQEKLAELVGVSFQAVSTWERDENLPDTEHLQILATALNTSIRYFDGTVHGFTPRCGARKEWSFYECW